MAANPSTSKKQSAANWLSKLPEPPAFFLDRSLGRLKVATALREAGAEVVIHEEHLGNPATHARRKTVRQASCAETCRTHRTILLASSNKGDLVLDPFMGSGTTLVTAFRLRRRALGCDLELESLNLSSLARIHPANQHVRDKIRQQLQVQRDLNLLEFVGRGKYRLR